MLKTLRIKNIALIKDLTLDFSSGLNAMTGETGAGKSIIIDSLNLILGDKGDKSLIRYGEETAVCEALFEYNSPELDGLLEDYGIESSDGEIMIVRRISINGKSDARVNGSAVTVQMLKTIGGYLCDIHGQHEHQSLLKASTHIVLVDKFGNDEISPLMSDYQSNLATYKDYIAKLSIYGEDADRERKLDTLKYQIDEITNANLSEGEEEDLLVARTKLQNYAKIIQSLSQAYTCLDGEEVSGVSCLSTARSSISQITQISPDYAEYFERLDSALIEVCDIADSICSELDNGEYDQREADRIDNRYNDIKLLKRKYGSTIADILKYRDEIQVEYDTLLNSAEILEKLNADIISTRQKLYSLASSISELRRKTAIRLRDDILVELSQLGMENTQFEIKFRPLPSIDEFDDYYDAKGLDNVEFLISPNKGEPLRPLNKIISGGEMSRFMLAVKCIIANLDDIGTLIFDEVDTGISGKIASVVAQKLAKVSTSAQVIAVTHLPHIASMADSNYFIHKEVVQDNTYTYVDVLEGEELVSEIARLCGGVSQGGLMHANDMLNSAKDYKKKL